MSQKETMELLKLMTTLFIDKESVPNFYGIMEKPKKAEQPDKTPKKKYYDNDIKFTYYGDTAYSNDHDGIITVASIVDDRNDISHYGVAYCSPKDVYIKEKGKKIAYKDLNMTMNTIAVRKKAHHDINAGIFCDIFSSGDYPSWAKSKIITIIVDHFVRMGY